MRLILLFLFCALSVWGAPTYTEFYCDSSISANNTNVNAGSTTGAPVYGPSVNGNWDGTSIFTPTDGSTPASTVSAGMWASVYLDAATVGVYIALVTNVAAGANGAITLSQANFMGAKPAAGATGRSIRVGGCWKGPFGSVIFPFGTIANTATNLSQNVPRVNFKSGANYAMTASGTHGNAGPIVFQGYGSTPGDGTRATIDGGANAINLFNSSAVNFITLADLVFDHNSSVGSSDGVRIGANNLVLRCSFLDFGRAGLNISSSGNIIVESEVSNCNLADNSGFAGFVDAGNCVYIRCVSRLNRSTTYGMGFRSTAVAYLIDCIAANNNGSGFQLNGAASSLFGCNAYSNTVSGVDFTIATAASFYLENCNFVQNGAYGIDSTGSSIRSGAIYNCGFGSGAYINTSGQLGPNITSSIRGYWVTNSFVDIASSPWSNPTNADFRLILSSLKATGRGSFTGNASSTVSYPDIGSAQTASTNAAISGGSWTFQQ